MKNIVIILLLAGLACKRNSNEVQPDNNGTVLKPSCTNCFGTVTSKSFWVYKIDFQEKDTTYSIIDTISISSVLTVKGRSYYRYSSQKAWQYYFPGLYPGMHLADSANCLVDTSGNIHIGLVDSFSGKNIFDNKVHYKNENKLIDTELGKVQVFTFEEVNEDDGYIIYTVKRYFATDLGIVKMETNYPNVSKFTAHLIYYQK